MIPQLARGSVGQASVAAHGGANRPILPFYKGRGNMLGIGISTDGFHIAADTNVAGEYGFHSQWVRRRFCEGVKLTPRQLSMAVQAIVFLVAYAKTGVGRLD